MKQPHDFYLEWIGKTVDVDGYYGCQCWDGVMKYFQWLGYPIFHCGGDGYVHNIWWNRKTSGILKYFEEVQRPYKDGDVLIWMKGSKQCPDSHIAIFRADNGANTFIALGTNQGGTNGAFNQKIFSYEGVLGGFRPKCYIPQKATAATTSKPTTTKPATAPAASAVKVEAKKDDTRYFYVVGTDGTIKEKLTSYDKALEKIDKDTVVQDDKKNIVATSEKRAVFRLYNPNSKAGVHQFTWDGNEYYSLMKFGWDGEGVAWYAPYSGDCVYRCCNPNGSDHLFTTRPDEHNDVIKNGWICEGLGFYSGGTVTVHRVYNKAGAHMYTKSNSEYNQLKQLGWKDEGEAFKAVS